MRSLVVSLALVLSAGTVSGQDIISDHSFGQNDGQHISPNTYTIPNWSFLGEGFIPQLLSDKVVVTPPYPGNKKAAIWCDNPNTLSEWSADFEFRAGGPDLAGGSLQLWYAKDGKTSIGTYDLYNVGKFDGMVLVVDTHGGRPSIRGFLNDGATEYKDYSRIEGLAFGHCDYSYRNLGRPSKLTVASNSAGLQVFVDGNPCFSTDQVTLPSGNTFGITASTTNTPDSFEVFKFVLKTGKAPAHSPPAQERHSHSPPSADSNSNTNQQDPITNIEQMANAPPKTSHPDNSYVSKSEFEDLNSRLYLISKAITNLFAEITKHTSAEESRYNEILARITTQGAVQQTGANTEQAADIIRKLSQLESDMQVIKQQFAQVDHKKEFRKLHEKVGSISVAHEGLPNHIREVVMNHVPRIGFILWSFCLFQVVLVAAYVVYKRRRWSAPKKYL